jgi:hypothetical protein
VTRTFSANAFSAITSAAEEAEAEQQDGDVDVKLRKMPLHRAAEGARMMETSSAEAVTAKSDGESSLPLVHSEPSLTIVTNWEDTTAGKSKMDEDWRSVDRSYVGETEQEFELTELKRDVNGSICVDPGILQSLPVARLVAAPGDVAEGERRRLQDPILEDGDRDVDVATGVHVDGDVVKNRELFAAVCAGEVTSGCGVQAEGRHTSADSSEQELARPAGSGPWRQGAHVSTTASSSSSSSCSIAASTPRGRDGRGFRAAPEGPAAAQPLHTTRGFQPTGTSLLTQSFLAGGGSRGVSSCSVALELIVGEEKVRVRLHATVRPLPL